jgi:hypothetical protein
MKDCFTQYFRCPDRYVKFSAPSGLSAKQGYFRLGADIICYGKLAGGKLQQNPADGLYDSLRNIIAGNGIIELPFDLREVIENLRNEVYLGTNGENDPLSSWKAKIYYLVRPFLSVAVRKHLQRARLQDWHTLPFPQWPVDFSVEKIFEQMMLLALKSGRSNRIPFIWFWPDGASSCALMTHDVETAVGRDFCETVMDIDDAFGMKASFQVIPEERYEVSPRFVDHIRERGFEVAVHDLNHDGRLFRDKEEFQSRAKKINAYGEKFHAEGFRAAILYRKQRWFHALDFAYDMSVPNVGHLEPQRGGCCTVFPFFIDDILEIPVTTTQDYSLFHILKNYSIDVWKRQIEQIMERHGLISFIVHPDYILGESEQQAFKALLGHLADLRMEKALWTPTPGAVNDWWRRRARMRIVEDFHGIRIEGEGSERARLAYASEKNGRLEFTLEDANRTDREVVNANMTDQVH